MNACSKSSLMPRPYCIRQQSGHSESKFTANSFANSEHCSLKKRYIKGFELRIYIYDLNEFIIYVYMDTMILYIEELLCNNDLIVIIYKHIHLTDNF